MAATTVAVMAAVVADSVAATALGFCSLSFSCAAAVENLRILACA